MPLARIDGGRHAILIDRYGLPADALIPALVSGIDEAGDRMIHLARELRRHAQRSDDNSYLRYRRRRMRAALTHIRRAWIAHCSGALAVMDLHMLCAHFDYERLSPLTEVAVRKFQADGRRKRTLEERVRDRNRRIVAAAAGGVLQHDLARDYRLTDRQIRNIKRKAKSKLAGK